MPAVLLHHLPFPNIKSQLPRPPGPTGALIDAQAPPKNCDVFPYATQTAAAEGRHLDPLQLRGCSRGTNMCSRCCSVFSGVQLDMVSAWGMYV